MIKKITIALLVVLIVVLPGIVFRYQHVKPNQKSNQPIITTSTQTQSINTTTTLVTTELATTTQTNDHPGMKRYRNTEWGFEFWYPEGWEVLENIYKGGASKFTLVAHPAGTYPNFEPFIINITTADFVEHSFAPYKDIATSTIIDGITSKIYKYESDTYYSNIVVSIGAIRIIISNSNNEHVPEFNKILSTFKFLK